MRMCMHAKCKQNFGYDHNKIDNHNNDNHNHNKKYNQHHDLDPFWRSTTVKKLEDKFQNMYLTRGSLEYCTWVLP